MILVMGMTMGFCFGYKKGANDVKSDLIHFFK